MKESTGHYQWTRVPDASAAPSLNLGETPRPTSRKKRRKASKSTADQSNPPVFSPCVCVCVRVCVCVSAACFVSPSPTRFRSLQKKKRSQKGAIIQCVCFFSFYLSVSHTHTHTHTHTGETAGSILPSSVPKSSLPPFTFSADNVPQKTERPRETGAVSCVLQLLRALPGAPTDQY